MSKELKKVNAGVDRTTRRFRVLKGAFTGLARSSNVAADKIKSFGQRAGVALGVAGAVGLRSALSFDKAMEITGAKAGITGKAFDALKLQALDWAIQSNFTGTEVANGMKVLASAGKKTKRELDLLTPAGIQLAQGSNLGIEASLNVLTNVMDGFSLPLEELGRVNDVLVNAVSNSKLDLPLFGQAMKNAGSQASVLKFKLTDISAALILMSRTGEVGAEAGTKVKNMLLKLVNPSEAAKKKLADLNERFEGFSLLDDQGILLNDLGEITKRFEGLRDLAISRNANPAKVNQDMIKLFTILFNARGGAAMTKIFQQGSKELVKEAKKLDVRGVTKDMSDRLTSGLTGAFNRLVTNLERIVILPSLGETGGLLTETIEAMQSAAKAVGDWIQANDTLIASKLIGWFETIQPLLDGFVAGVTVVKDAVIFVSDTFKKFFPAEFMDDMLTSTNALKALGENIGILFTSAVIAGLIALGFAMFTAFSPLTVAIFAVLTLINLIRKLNKETTKISVPVQQTSLNALVARRNELSDMFFQGDQKATPGQIQTIQALDRQIKSAKDKLAATKAGPTDTNFNAHAGSNLFGPSAPSAVPLASKTNETAKLVNANTAVMNNLMRFLNTGKQDGIVKLIIDDKGKNVKAVQSLDGINILVEGDVGFNNNVTGGK